LCGIALNKAKGTFENISTKNHLHIYFEATSFLSNTNSPTPHYYN
jgi:hypothetical protein